MHYSMVVSLLAICFCFVVSLAFTYGGSPWSPAITSAAEKLLSQLSDEEKFQFVHGITSVYAGETVPVNRLGIPPLHLEDGPQGVGEYCSQVTQFPSALTVVSSFDVSNYYLFGKTQAEEQVLKGTNVLLGPMVNLARIPQGGRNFESVGEDPTVAAAYAREMIAGVQSQKIMACVKHAYLNSQEYERGTVSEVASERTVRELYYPAFQAAVDVGVASAMCAYNRINGTYSCENPKAIGWLKDTAGFQGYVMSDWGATHSTVASANAGLDLEMRTGEYFGDQLVSAVAAGNVSKSRVDDMVLRILRAMIATEVINYPPTGNTFANATSAKHNEIARKLAEDGTVLLKNDGNFLPLNPEAFLPNSSGHQSIAVIGDETTVHGGGSGAVYATYLSTPYGGIAKLLLQQPGAPTRPVSCTFEHGIEYIQLDRPQTHLEAKDEKECCATCTAEPDCFFFSFHPQKKQCFLKRNDAGRISGLGNVTSGSCAPLPLPIQYQDGKSLSPAIELAKTANVTIVVVAITSKEGLDRTDLSLGFAQDELITALASVTQNLVVVVRSPGTVQMPWIQLPSVRAVVWQGLPGQEGGNAVANVLFGKKNPSGRLPLSFPKDLSDTWIQSAAQYPGIVAPEGFLEATYSEELLMGYRWYVTKDIRPLFPFGYGLSYSEVFYSQLLVNGSLSATSSVSISFNITNRSSRDMEDIVQLYISYPSHVMGEPKYVLRRFAKVYVGAGQTLSCFFDLNASDVLIWDTLQSMWQRIQGSFVVAISNNGPFEMRLFGSFESVEDKFDSRME